MHEGETGYMLQRLRERSLDLIICRSQYTAPELQNLEIMNEPLRVALPPQHPLCEHAQVPLAALRHELSAAQLTAGHGHFGHVAARLPAGRIHPGSGILGRGDPAHAVDGAKGLGVAFAKALPNWVCRVCPRWCRCRMPGCART
jgi:DNA-binding transcriptional LysR family regulator